jgi:hypothetical protein
MEGLSAVIASQRVHAISAFTRVVDALWRGPVTGSAKQIQFVGLLRRFAPRNDVCVEDFALGPRFRGDERPI